MRQKQREKSQRQEVECKTWHMSIKVPNSNRNIQTKNPKTTTTKNNYDNYTKICILHKWSCLLCRSQRSIDITIRLFHPELWVCEPGHHWTSRHLNLKDKRSEIIWLKFLPALWNLFHLSKGWNHPDSFVQRCEKRNGSSERAEVVSSSKNTHMAAVQAAWRQAVDSESSQPLRSRSYNNCEAPRRP